ncbi:MAG: hypothetical protein ACKO7W_11280 [Elainella sp.]
MKSFHPATPINSGNARSNIVPFQVKHRVALPSFWERFWESLYALLVPTSEPRIKQIGNPKNPEAYQVYDPVRHPQRSWWLDECDRPKGGWLSLKVSVG